MLTVKELKERNAQRIRELQYQANMIHRDLCACISRDFLKKGDVYMFTFWANASREYERRAREVS